VYVGAPYAFNKTDYYLYKKKDIRSDFYFLFFLDVCCFLNCITLDFYITYIGIENDLVLYQYINKTLLASSFVEF
jgi:hypothetical protein